MSEVVRAGLRALKERDEAVARWLHEEVAPVYDAMKSDPGKSGAIDDAFSQLRLHHSKSEKGSS